jgi:hypothetical protein
MDLMKVIFEDNEWSELAPTTKISWNAGRGAFLDEVTCSLTKL